MKLTPATNRCSPVAGGGGRLRGEYRRGGGTGDLQAALILQRQQLAEEEQQRGGRTASCRQPPGRLSGAAYSQASSLCICRLSCMVRAELAWLLWIWQTTGRLAFLSKPSSWLFHV